MKLSEIFRLVILNILENKFKVVLTSIGIIVGAATIVLVVAVGRGGQMDVADQFKNLNAASIEITASASTGSFSAMRGESTGRAAMMPPGGAMPSGGMVFFGGASLRTVSASLEEADAEDIAFFVPDVVYSTISSNGKRAVLGGGMESEEQYTVAAVKPEYAQVSNLSLYLGEFISQEDEEDRVKNCVLGYTLAVNMFGSVIEAYDSVITIDGTNFVVVGVLRQMGAVSSGISPDEAVYVPYSTGSKYVFGREMNPQLTVVAGSTDQVQAVIEDLTILLNENHPGASFAFSDAGSKMEAAQQASKTLSMLLMVIAVIVFVIGGIGIMNVLFVSVKERTREIGVLKAIGMQRSHILLEFLLEAIMISMIGGVLGIALSALLIPIAERFAIRMEPVAAAYTAAFGFAVICGTVFGFYPAVKASKLIPAEALTQD